ncbi:MAG: LPP20 family lipoprotein [Tenuifilaceae bacterium]
MNLKLVAPILLTIIISSCGGSKKIEVQNLKPTPTWVQNRPVSSTFYVGIGTSTKTMDINQTQQTAKQNALADLASDISINISSNSLLSAFETNTSFTEDYSKTIKSQSEQDLEGYEVVDSYEDQSNYWIYFRLSKTEYQRIKEERKNKAVTRSLDLYDKAIAAEQTGDTRLALINLIKALEPIKIYFSDPLQVNYQGKEIFLGNEIYNKISQVLSSIQLDASNKQIKVKQGQNLPAGSLEFKVLGQNKQSLSGFPVTATYTEKPIRNSKIVTDVNGIAAFNVDPVRSNKNIETLKGSLNLEVIVNEASTDYVIRKLFTRFRSPEASITINIIKPVFYISSSETNLDEKLSPAPLAEGLKREILKSGYSTTDNLSEADYQINITSETKNKGESGSYKQTILTAKVSVRDKSNAEIYSKQLDNIQGTHFNYQSAGLEAYKEATKKVENTISREIIEGVVKGKSAY